MLILMYCSIKFCISWNYCCKEKLRCKIGSQHLLASTSSTVLPGRGSEKAFNEFLGVTNDGPSYHHEVASISLGEVNRESSSVLSVINQLHSTATTVAVAADLTWHAPTEPCLLIVGPFLFPLTQYTAFAL